MRNISAIEAISRYAPGIPVSDALALLSEIQPVEAVKVSSPEDLVSATLWAEKSFGPGSQGKKIQVIKEIRNRFGLSLRESKAIADSISYHVSYNG